MKIAIDIRTAGGEKAGKGWFTFHITQNLLKVDKENEYILYVKDKIAGFEEFKNAELKQIKGSGFFWHRNVAKDVKKEKVDLFFAPSSYIIPALLPKSIKTILTIHDLVAFLFPETHNRKANLIERLFIKTSLKKTAHVITVSDNTKKDVQEKFKFYKNPITTIYNAADETYKPVAKEKLTGFIKKTNLPKKFFVAVGTLIPRKNYPNLIKALALLHKTHPEYQLLIVGGKGWHEQEIHDLIKQNYLSKKVHLLGYLSTTAIRNLYNLAKALVFPSFYEGFGIPPLEAMKSGCPVIASYTSSIPEVVGDAALLIDPESPEAIARAMKKIVVDDELAESLRNKGLAQGQKFSWERSAEKLLEIIEDLK
jgi:glycosyltransferase involved in cell wall biosynthesis